MSALASFNYSPGKSASLPVKRRATPPVARGRRRLREADKDEIVRRYESGQDSKTVAEGLGFAKSTVLRVLRQRGVEVRPWGVTY